MTPLESILAQYRTAAQRQKEEGSYFDELIRTYPPGTLSMRLSVSLETMRGCQG